MALAADEAPHFLPAGVDVRIVRPLAVALAPALDAGQMRNAVVALGQCGDSLNESGPRDAHLHRLRVVAVDAAHGMSVADVCGSSVAAFSSFASALGGITVAACVAPPGNSGGFSPGVPSGVLSSSAWAAA